MSGNGQSTARSNGAPTSPLLDAVQAESKDTPGEGKPTEGKDKVAALKTEGVQLSTAVGLIVSILLIVFAVGLWFVSSTAALIIGIIVAALILLWLVIRHRLAKKAADKKQKRNSHRNNDQRSGAGARQSRFWNSRGNRGGSRSGGGDSRGRSPYSRGRSLFRNSDGSRRNPFRRDDDRSHRQSRDSARQPNTNGRSQRERRRSWNPFSRSNRNNRNRSNPSGGGNHGGHSRRSGWNPFNGRSHSGSGSNGSSRGGGHNGSKWQPFGTHGKHNGKTTSNPGSKPHSKHGGKWWPWGRNKKSSTNSGSAGNVKPTSVPTSTTPRRRRAWPSGAKQWFNWEHPKQSPSSGPYYGPYGPKPQTVHGTATRTGKQPHTWQPAPPGSVTPGHGQLGPVAPEQAQPTTTHGATAMSTDSGIQDAQTGRPLAATHIGAADYTNRSAVDHLIEAFRCRLAAARYLDTDDPYLHAAAAMLTGRAAGLEEVAENRAALTATHVAAASDAVNGGNGQGLELE